MPWEAVVQDDGCGLMEASSPFLGYRKMFCWGTGKSGRNWQRFLAPERDGSYVEIQAGLAPTQFHDKFIEAESSVRWLQMFGPVAIGRRTANYTEERNDVTQAVETLLDAKRIVREEKRRSKELDEPETQMLHYGNGWAYLEKTVCKEEPDVVYRVRRKTSLLSFPMAPLGGGRKAPAYDPLRLPPVIGQPWMELLKRSEGEPMSLSYWGGIMLAETGKDAEALELFQLVHKHMHDAYSARNIARILLREGKKRRRFFGIRPLPIPMDTGTIPPSRRNMSLFSWKRRNGRPHMRFYPSFRQNLQRTAFGCKSRSRES